MLSISNRRKYPPIKKEYIKIFIKAYRKHVLFFCISAGLPFLFIFLSVIFISSKFFLSFLSFMFLLLCAIICMLSEGFFLQTRYNKYRDSGYVFLLPSEEKSIEKLILKSYIPQRIYTVESINDDSSKVHLDASFLIPLKKLKCPNCNRENSVTAKICKFCSNEFLKCNICNRSISSKEEVYCPSCKTAYHKLEFLEWLKVKAHCPKCNYELDLWEFQKFIEKNHEEFSILCPKCTKNIPNDAKFCIFCGFKVN